MTEEDAFPSWRSYREFQREVMQDWRYLHRSSARAFLDRLARQAHDRVSGVKEGHGFCRAQVAHGFRYEEMIDEEVEAAAPPSRMRPLPRRATEGRLNPKGIPCLYVATDKHTAVAEVRPWIGSKVTLAYFRTERPLRLVDCTRDMESHIFYFEGEPSAEARNTAVWADLGRALQEPVLRDDAIAEYAPTQVIGELFRSEGFDGVAYRTAFGRDADRFSVALFDLAAARQTYAELLEIRDVTFNIQDGGDSYEVRPRDDGGVDLMRTVITDIRPIPKPGEGAPDEEPDGA